MMKAIIVNFVISGMLLLMTVPALSQQTGQQQQQQQMQQMQQMQEMMQRMNGLMERNQQMNRDMNQRMQQAQNEQMRNQYQMMHRFSEQMGMTLGNMKNAAERCEMMLKDREMMRDRQMQQDMERMKKHLSDLTTEMDESLKTMERMVQRMKQRQPQ